MDLPPTMRPTDGGATIADPNIDIDAELEKTKSAKTDEKAAGAENDDTAELKTEDANADEKEADDKKKKDE